MLSRSTRSEEGYPAVSAISERLRRDIGGMPRAKGGKDQVQKIKKTEPKDPPETDHPGSTYAHRPLMINSTYYHMLCSVCMLRCPSSRTARSVYCFVLTAPAEIDFARVFLSSPSVHSCQKNCSFYFSFYLPFSIHTHPVLACLPITITHALRSTPFTMMKSPFSLFRALVALTVLLSVLYWLVLLDRIASYESWESEQFLRRIQLKSGAVGAGVGRVPLDVGMFLEAVSVGSYLPRRYSLARRYPLSRCHSTLSTIPHSTSQLPVFRPPIRTEPTDRGRWR